MAHMISITAVAEDLAWIFIEKIMEGLSSMKRYLYLVAAALVAAALPGCTLEEQIDMEGTHTVVINTGEAGLTRTSISPSGSGYSVDWQEGDMINLIEIVPSLKEQVRIYKSAPLAASDINPDGTANFVVSLDNARSGQPAYQYIAQYPGASKEMPSCNYLDWSSSSDKMYAAWANEWGYSGSYVDPHASLQLYMPSFQSPTASSFDPAADLMVSKAVLTSLQLAGDASMQFSRVGTIVKMTLRDLDEFAGYNVMFLDMQFEKSYGPVGRLMYDPSLEKVKYLDSENRIGISPEYGSVVKADGTLDVWFRAFPGTITDSFSVTVTLDDGKKNVKELYRSVDLAKMGRTLSFAEGSLTSFSVGQPWGDAPQPPYLFIPTPYPGIVATSDPGSFSLDVETNQDMNDVTFSCDVPGVTFDKGPLAEGISIVTVNYPASGYENDVTYHLSAAGPNGYTWSYEFTQPKRVFSFSAPGDGFVIRRTNYAGTTTVSNIQCNFTPSLTATASWVTPEYVVADSQLDIKMSENTSSSDRTASVTMSDPLNPEHTITYDLEQFRTEPGGEYYIIGFDGPNAYLMGDYSTTGYYHNSHFHAIPVTFDSEGKIVEVSELTADRKVTITKTAQGYTVGRNFTAAELGPEDAGFYYFRGGKLKNEFDNMGYRNIPISKTLDDVRYYWNISWYRNISKLFTDIYTENAGAINNEGVLDPETGSILFMKTNTGDTAFGFDTTAKKSVWCDADTWNPFVHSHWTAYKIVLYKAE